MCAMMAEIDIGKSRFIFLSPLTQASRGSPAGIPKGFPFGKDGKRRTGCAGQSGFTALIFSINAVKCNLAVGGLAAQTPLQRAVAHRAVLTAKSKTGKAVKEKEGAEIALTNSRRFVLLLFAFPLPDARNPSPVPDGG